MEEISINTAEIKLDQFLKWARIVASGGEAKALIQAGEILVNGKKETRRAYKLKPGDVVEIAGENKSYRVIKN